jgi:RNA polymerase sigma-70 factor (ECF subfamily)
MMASLALMTSNKDGDPATRSSGAELTFDSTIEVLKRAKQGDRSAGRVLIERALPPLRRWTRGRLPFYARAGNDTEDVVQDALLRTLKGVDRLEYRTVNALQAYLRQAVVNRIRDLIRGSRRRGVAVEPEEELPDTRPSPLERAILGQRLDEFLEALQRLRPADRQVVVWRIELGYSTDDIAHRLGKSKAAASMTVTRALARLRNEMKAEKGPS